MLRFFQTSLSFFPNHKLPTPQLCCLTVSVAVVSVSKKLSVIGQWRFFVSLHHRSPTPLTDDRHRSPTPLTDTAHRPPTPSYRPKPHRHRLLNPLVIGNFKIHGESAEKAEHGIVLSMFIDKIVNCQFKPGQGFFNTVHKRL